MPKLERLDWVLPLSEGKGVTLTDSPEADLFLAEDPAALLMGVLCDSQFQTRRAFAIPLILRQRIGHFELRRMLDESDSVRAAFVSKPALHRFPNRCADLSLKLVAFIVERYDGDAARMWSQSQSADDLGQRLIELPAFGAQKVDWTVGMLGRMGVLAFDGWDGYRIPAKPKKRQPAATE